jgi:hypothetical protein
MSKWLEIINTVLRDAKLSRKSHKRKKTSTDSHTEIKKETTSEKFNLNLEHNILKCKTKNRSRPSGRRLPLRKSRDTIVNTQADNVANCGQEKVAHLWLKHDKSTYMNKIFSKPRRSSSCNDLWDFEKRTSLEVSKIDSNISTSYMFLPPAVNGPLDTCKLLSHQEDIQSVYVYLDKLRLDLSNFEKYIKSLELMIKENKANWSKESFESKSNQSLNQIKINYNLFFYHSAQLIEKLKM